MKTPDRFSANRDLLQTPESRRKPSDCMNTPTAVTPHHRTMDAYVSQHGKLVGHQSGMEHAPNFSDFPSLQSMVTEDTSGSSFNAASSLDGLKQEIPTYGFNDLLLNLELNLPIQEPRLDIQNFVIDNPIPSVNQLLPFSDNLPLRPINVELKNAQIMKNPVKDNADNIDDSTMKNIPSVPSEKVNATRTEVSDTIATYCVPSKPLQVNKSVNIIGTSIQKCSSQKDNLHEASTDKLCPKRATSMTQSEPVHPSIEDSSLMPSSVKNKRQNPIEKGIMIGPDQSKTIKVGNQSNEAVLESNSNLKQSPPSVSECQPKINSEIQKEQTHAVSVQRNHNEVTNRILQGSSVANTHHLQYQPPSHHHQYHQHPSQSRVTNFLSQPSKPETLNGPKQQFPNQSECPPYQYMHPQSSANAYLPTATSYPPYSYNHAPYGMATYHYPYQFDRYYSPYYQEGPGYYGYNNSYSRQYSANAYYSIQQPNHVMRSNNNQATNVARFNGQQSNVGMRSNTQAASQVASLHRQQVQLGTKSNDQQANHVARFNNQKANPGMRFNGCQTNQVGRSNDEQGNPVTRFNGHQFPYYSLNGIKRMKLPEAPTQVNKVTSSYLDHNKNRVENLLNSDQCTNLNNVHLTNVQNDEPEIDSLILNGNPIEDKMSSAATATKNLTNTNKTEVLAEMSGSNLTKNCTKCTNLKARIHSIKKSRRNDHIFIIHDTDDDSCDDEVYTFETEKLEEDLGILCDDCGGVIMEEVLARPETDDPEEKDSPAVSPKNEFDECVDSNKSDVESLQYIEPSEVSIFKLIPQDEPKLTDFTAQNMKFLPQSSRSIFTPVGAPENSEASCISEPKNKRKTRKSRKAKNETTRGQTNRGRGPGRPKGGGTRLKKKNQNNGKKCWNCFATKSSTWYTHRRQTKSHLCCSCYNYYKARNEQDRKHQLKEQTYPCGPIIQQTSPGSPIIQHLKNGVSDGQNDYEKPVNNGKYDSNPATDIQHDDALDIPVFLPQALEVSLVDRKTSALSESLSEQDSVKKASNEKKADFDVHILNVHKTSNIFDQSNQKSLNTNYSGFSEDFFGDLFDIDIELINDVVNMNNKTLDELDLNFFQNIDCSSLINSGETLRVLEITNDKPQFCQQTVQGEGSRSNQPETRKKPANLKPKSNQRKKSSKRSKRKEKLNVGTVTVKKSSKCHTVDVMPEGKTPVFSYSFTLPDDF